MIKEPYKNQNSVIQRLDPRVKIIIASIYSLNAALAVKTAVLIPTLVFSVTLIALSKPNYNNLCKRLFMANLFLLFFWLILPFTFNGIPLFRIGMLNISLDGVILCTKISIKSNAIILALIALFSSMPVPIIGHALNRLNIPDKLVNLLLITYRYLFVIHDEYQRLIRSAKIRGFQPKTDLHTYRTYAYCMAMLFIRATEKAEKVHQAMICRGFNGKFYCLSDFSLSWLDLKVSIIMGMVMFGLGIIEWTQIIY